MIFTPTTLEGNYEVTLEPRSDNRGWFARVYCKDEFKQINHTKEWVQGNHSFTAAKGAIRGLHFQNKPQSEIKLVRCIAGAVYDVAVDLRKDSKTFLKWYATELSAAKKNMMYIPEGFAHGFQTLSEDCELIYLHSEYYNAEVEGAIRYNDPAVNINWPFPVTDVSERDSNHALLNNQFKGI
jgi:dTDP-4-dehydrorhamnose 3,5-epimerase